MHTRGLPDRQASAFLIRVTDRNIAASLISYLLRGAQHDSVISADDILYDIIEEPLVYFIQIVSPRYFITDILLSWTKEQKDVSNPVIRLLEQVDRRIYLEVGCENEIYGPFQDPEEPNRIRCIECDQDYTLEILLKPLSQLFRGGPTSEILSWSNTILKTGASEIARLLALIYIMLDLHLEPKEQTQDAELWVIDKKNQSVLLDALSYTREEDLKSITIAEAELDGRDIFIIREMLSAGKISRLIPWEGEHLYISLANKSLPNMFIPNNQELYPELTSECLTSMFGYSNQNCTILDTINGDILVTHISIAAFRPINQVIRYVVPTLHTNYALSVDEPFKLRRKRNPNHFKRIIQERAEKIQPSRMYKAARLEPKTVSSLNIAFRLEITSAKKSPDLWLVPVSRGIALIQFLEKQDPRNFLIACIGNKEGEPDFFLVKEALSGSEVLPTIKDYSYSADRDIQNLYIPYDKVIEPSLSPERYQQHLKILPGELTILEGTGEAIKVIKIVEKDIYPVRSINEIRSLSIYSAPSIGTEWKRAKKPKVDKPRELPESEPEQPKKKTEAIMPPEETKKRTLRKKKTGVTWDAVQSRVQQAGIVIPIEKLAGQLSLGPADFLTKVDEHISSLTKWKKERGL